MRAKSILTYFDGTDVAERQMFRAISLSHRMNAHLSVAAIGYEADAADDADRRAAPACGARTRATEDAIRRARDVAARLAATGVRGDSFPFVTTRAGLARQVGSLARYVDLVVSDDTASANPMSEAGVPGGQAVD